MPAKDSNRRWFSSPPAMRALVVLLVAAALLGGLSTAAPMGTAFTYQGQLKDAGLPANAAYDFQFKLFDAATAGAQIGSTVLKGDVAVAGGLFSVSLDFGSSPFGGQARFLEIGVRPGASTDAYTLLGARHELTPSPNALFATSAGAAVTATSATTAGIATTVAAGAINTTQLANGAVTSAKIGTGAVTAGAIASGEVVKSLNDLMDSVAIVGSGGATVSTEGKTITVAAAAPPVAGAVVLGVSGDTTLIGSGYTELFPAADGWTATAMTAGVPSVRSEHTAVWTGTKMIVWGGYGGTLLNTGGQYDPVSNSWTATSITGSVPSARYQHTAVWTGSKMIVWGGSDGTYLNTGGQYDPVGNSWSATAITAGVPSARSNHTAVWTGSKMIVWGGSGATYPVTGGLYDPGTNSWTATATTAGVPSGRVFHTAVWTGSKMIVWGGTDGTALNTGGQYDPAGNSWTATSVVGSVPSARRFHTAVWTGSRMIVWGGYDVTFAKTGGQYDPVGNSWTGTSITSGNVPVARQAHSAVWTGTKMVVWGGTNGAGSLLNTGGQYDPMSDSWTANPNTGNLPSGRADHTAVWTGTKMIIWGGYDEFGTYLNTGGQRTQLSYFIKN